MKKVNHPQSESEMKIYTPHSTKRDNQATATVDHAPVRIYERPLKPNQPTSPLG